MKVERLTVRNFKRFENLTVEFSNRLTGEVAEQFLILGDNGSGKTTLLQAIALCLYLASKNTASLENFDWVGWLPGRYQRWGRPYIELSVAFSATELEATQEAARRWWGSLSEPQRKGEFREPGSKPRVVLRLDGERLLNEGSELAQFRGRSYAAYLLRTDPTARELFDRLPGVFWFDQFRNLATPQAVREGENGDGAGEGSASRISYTYGVAGLRKHLNNWMLARIEKGAPLKGHDYLQELQNSYKRVFPGRSFSHPEPMFRGGVPTPSDYYFMIDDGSRTYDIEEMSSGEQSVFPILYEFVRQQIRNSVVLVDEIDLNLHPPLAQALISYLPQIGKGCQFIYTTHSAAVSETVSPEQVYRLPGGRLCL